MNGNNKIFIDTNLWVYLYAKSPKAKYQKVKQIVDDNFQDTSHNGAFIGRIPSQAGYRPRYHRFHLWLFTFNPYRGWRVPRFYHRLHIF